MGNIARIYTSIAAACIMTPLDVNAANNGLHLEPLFWTVQLEYSGAKEDRVGIGSSQTHRTTEKILLRQTGYWLDPKLVDFSIGLTPTFFQEQFSGELQDFHSSGGSFDYDISFGFLRGAKNLFDVGTQASRVTGSYSSDLGNYIDYMSEDLSVTLGVKLAPFPMTLIYGKHILDQETNSGSGASSRYREEIQQSLRWRAHSSKLDVLVDRRWFDDRIGENDYDSLDQSVTHVFRWGKGSSLASRQKYFQREGASSYSRFGISENLQLRHFKNLQSKWSYQYATVKQDKDISSSLGKFELEYQPAKKLELTLSVEQDHKQFIDGSEDIRGGRVGITFRSDVVWGGKLRADLGGSTLQTERRSDNTTFDTVDASYLVPDTLIVLLNTTGIEQGSILVTDSAGNFVFQQGDDYEVHELSNDLTELQILSSGLIGAGNTILVSFNSVTGPTASFNTEEIRLGLTLDFDWLRFYHSTRVFEERLKSGSFDKASGDTEDHTTGVESSWKKDWFEATARAERHLYTFGVFSTNSDSLSGTAQITISPRARLFLSTSIIDFLSDGQEIDFSQSEAKLIWEPSYGLSVKPFVRFWSRKEALGRYEERLKVGAHITWKVRKFNLDLEASHNQYSTQSSENSNQRLGIRITRRSR